MTDIMNYLEYFKFFLEKLSISKQQNIKNYLILNQICPVELSETGLPIDNSKKDITTFIYESFAEEKKAILLFQYFELFLEYKYSIFYKIENATKNRLKEIINKKNEIFYSVEEKVEKMNVFNDTKSNNFKIESIGVFENRKLYLKIPIGIEKKELLYDQIFKTKMLFLCIIDLDNDVLEIRYDGLNQPFTTNQEFYLALVKKIKNFIEETFIMHLKIYDFEFIAKEIDELREKGHDIVRKESDFNDFGSAALTCNNKNKLPYIDELKEIIRTKGEEFKDDNTKYEVAQEIYDTMISFLNTKEENSNCIKVILKIKDYKTHFNYTENSDVGCFIQHEGINLRKDNGRCDYVRETILQLEKQFNRIGISGE